MSVAESTIYKGYPEGNQFKSQFNSREQAITIYHSPDADDAFMFYGLVNGAINLPGFSFSHELAPIESLNQRALRGEIEVTAVSVHVVPYLKDRYTILRVGASMGGETYGPRIMTKSATDIKQAKLIASPGRFTSANLALRMYLKEHNIEAQIIDFEFDQVQHAILSGKVDAGVIIHEGQLSGESIGLSTILDLGVWWWERTALPLPLGVNVVRKDLGERAIKAVKQALLGSIRYSMDNRSDALDYALSYGRGINKSDADVFVGMYVNDLTLELGEQGISSIKRFLKEAYELALVPEHREPEFY